MHYLKHKYIYFYLFFLLFNSILVLVGGSLNSWTTISFIEGDWSTHWLTIFQPCLDRMAEPNSQFNINKFSDLEADTYCAFGFTNRIIGPYPFGLILLAIQESFGLAIPIAILAFSLLHLLIIYFFIEFFKILKISNNFILVIVILFFFCSPTASISLYTFYKDTWLISGFLILLSTSFILFKDNQNFDNYLKSFLFFILAYFLFYISRYPLLKMIHLFLANIIIFYLIYYFFINKFNIFNNLFFKNISYIACLLIFTLSMHVFHKFFYINFENLSLDTGGKIFNSRSKISTNEIVEKVISLEDLENHNILLDNKKKQLNIYLQDIDSSNINEDLINLVNEIEASFIKDTAINKNIKLINDTIKKFKNDYNSLYLPYSNNKIDEATKISLNERKKILKIKREIIDELDKSIDILIYNSKSEISKYDKKQNLTTNLILSSKNFIDNKIKVKITENDFLLSMLDKGNLSYNYTNYLSDNKYFLAFYNFTKISLYGLPAHRYFDDNNPSISKITLYYINIISFFLIIMNIFFLFKCKNKILLLFVLTLSFECLLSISYYNNNFGTFIRHRYVFWKLLSSTGLIFLLSLIFYNEKKRYYK